MWDFLIGIDPAAFYGMKIAIVMPIRQVANPFLNAV
jgi:hypothetical protein